jgi:tetratricopeptide (TPR) repeat protein
MNLQAWGHFYRGRMLERFRRPEAAADAYRLALATDPRFARAADALGYLHACRKDYAVAEQWFSESVRLAASNANAWFNLAFVREAQGRHEEAIQAFAETVRINPLFDRAWYGMGLCHATLGRHEEAARSLG